MLVDANVLLYAVDDTSPFNTSAVAWLEEVLNGSRRVGMAWPTLTAFLRITTHPGRSPRPLTPASACYDLRGNLMADADLSALAIEHGLSICFADTDFARFREICWINPIASVG